jgi:hypothetical protein
LALRQRVQRSLRVLRITLGCAVIAVVLGTVADPDNGLVAFLIVILAMVGGVTALIGGGGLVRTAGFLRLMRRGEWIVYTVEKASLYRSPMTMTLVGHDMTRYPVALYGATESVRAMLRPEVWFVGDPSGRGILTVAGGGEMLRARPDHGRGIALIRRPAKPSKPRPPRPVDPEKARRQAARAAAHRAKVQEKAKARADKRKANPPTRRQPAKLSRFPWLRGGQKIKWR